MIKKIILEFNRNEILDAVDNEFINHKGYTNQLKKKIGRVTINSKNWYIDKLIGGTVDIKILNSTGKRYYDNIISFTDDYKYLSDNFKFNEYDMTNTTSREKMVNDIMYYFNQMIVGGDILVGCTCPAYLYWGYKYQATQADYGIRRSRENRYPMIRNPGLYGSICKHLDITLTVIGKNPIKQYLVEYLSDNFLKVQLKRRYKKNFNKFWLKNFKYI